MIEADGEKTEYFEKFREYLKCQKAYAIMPVGKMIKVLKRYAKSPGGRDSGAFLFRFGKVAYALGWLPVTHLHPAICRYSRQLYLP